MSKISLNCSQRFSAFDTEQKIQFQVVICRKRLSSRVQGLRQRVGEVSLGSRKYDYRSLTFDPFLFPEETLRSDSFLAGNTFLQPNLDYLLATKALTRRLFLSCAIYWLVKMKLTPGIGIQNNYSNCAVKIHVRQPRARQLTSNFRSKDSCTRTYTRM